MALSLLKILSVGVVATLIFSSPGIAPSWSADLTTLPDKAYPLSIDLKKRRVLLYTEVNLKNWDKTNPHWGVVYRGGKLRDKRILAAYATPEEFHAALLQIGARPGNNLTPDQTNTLVQGDELSVSVFRPDLNNSFSMADTSFDQTGKGFPSASAVTWRGPPKKKPVASPVWKAALWGSPTMPLIRPSGTGNGFFPNSLFKGKTGTLPVRKGTPVILICELVNPKNL